MNKKFTYSKMTFLLSVFGFIGSIGFYIGVLRKVYAEPKGDQVKIELLEHENKQLKTQVQILTEVVNECKDNA